MQIKLLLAVITITTILMVGTVSANPRLYIEDRLVVPGSEVKIPVMVQDVQDLANMDFRVSWLYSYEFGKSLLTVEQVEKGSLNQQSLFEYNTASGEPLTVVDISFASTRGMSGSGSVAVLTCRATNTPEMFGTNSNIFNIFLTTSVAQTSSGAPVVFATSNGKFEFGTSTLRGDCDGNGKITTNDAQMTLQMAVNKLGQNMICDMNDDKSVNSIDVREILKLSQVVPTSVVSGVQKQKLAGGQQASALPGTGGIQKAGGQQGSSVPAPNTNQQQESAATHQIARYGITVVTGEKAGDETDGDVYITIAGENAIIRGGGGWAIPSCFKKTEPTVETDCIYNLKLDNTQDNFQRGKVDYFTITTEDLGEISQMSLHFFSEEEDPYYWYCKEVYIENEMTNKAWIFPVNRGFNMAGSSGIFQATPWDPNNIPSPT